MKEFDVMDEQILERIKALVYKNLDLETEQKTIDVEDDLKTFGMDSIIFIQFVVDLELEFGINIDPEYLLLENMSTIKKAYDIVFPLIQS